MLLKFGSLLLIIIITIYCIYHFHRNKNRFSGIIGRLSSLLFGISSAALGFIAIQVLNYNLVWSIIIALFISLCGGYLVRRLFSKNFWINTTLSSLIGFLIGFVFGYMTFISNIPYLIVDVIYILLIYLLLMYSDKMAGQNSKMHSMKKKKEKQKKPLNITSVFLGAILLIFVGILAANINNIKIGVIGQPQNQAASQDDQNDLQNATIHITPSGFNPNKTTFKAKTMMKVIIDVDPQAGDNLKLISNDLKLNMNLKKGKNILLLDNPLKGEYSLTVNPGNFSGTLQIK